MRGHIVLYVLAAAVLPLAVGLLVMTSVLGTPGTEVAQDAEMVQMVAALVVHDVDSTMRIFSLGKEGFELAKLPAAETTGVLRILYRQDDDVDLVVLLDGQNQPVVAPVFLEPEQLGPASGRHLPVEGAEIERFLKNVPAEAARERGRAFSDVYADRRRNVALLAGAVAVPAGEGQPAWVLGFERSLARVQQSIGMGMNDPNRLLFVVDGGGRVVAHPDGRRFLERELLAEHPLVASYLTGRSSDALSWRDNKQQEQRGAFQRIESLDWAVVVQRLSPTRFAGGVPGWAWGGWAVVALLILLTGLQLEAKVRRVNRDMKVLQEAAEQKAEAVKRLQASVLETRKLDAIGDLGAGVAHEFNNPIGGILGLTQLLLRKKKESDPEVEFLRRIETEAKRCKEITENLLRFSEQQTADHREPLHLGRVIDLTLDLLTKKFESQRIRVERTYATNLPRVLGNEGQLRRAFLNVLLNAETAMPEGGRLTVSTGREDSWLVAKVADTGRGIPKENLSRIFEPFFTTKDNWKGAGLGLSVVYQVVQEHNGQVTVESEVGKGTLVVFKFPIFESKASSAMTVPLA